MKFFASNADRVAYFKRRVEALGRSGADTVVTVLNVDDSAGSVLADILMPGYDWQAIRDRGEVPVARGLAEKAGIIGFLEEVGYKLAAQELRNTDDLRTLVLDHGVALALDVEFGTDTKH